MKKFIIAMFCVFICSLCIQPARSASFVTGRVREALSLSGSDYVNAGGVSDSVKTVAFWAKPTTTTQKFLELNGSAYIDVTSGTIAATGFTSPIIYIDGVAASALSDTNWHHIAITTAVAVNGNMVNIGKVGTTYFSGLIDEVAIYNRALSATELLAVFNSTKRTYIQTDNNTGLVGAWDLDSDDYNQTTDVVYGKHGSDNLTAVSDPVLTTGPDGTANTAILFDGTADYLKQKVHDTQQGVLSYQGNDTTTAEFRDTTQDFSAWQSSTNALYMIVVTNSDTTTSWGYCGMANNSNADIDIYTTKAMASRGWNGIAPVAGGKTPSSYEVRKTDFQLTGALTVGAWVKGVAQSDKAVLSKYETTKNKRSWNMGASNLSTSKFQVLLSSNGSSITKDYTSGLTAFDSNWHLISFTYDGNNTLKLYVDGVLDTPTKTTDTAMTTIYDADKSIATGAYSANYAATGFFNGSIARPFIYNRALSATEVLNLYNNTKRLTYIGGQVDKNGLVGKWDLDSNNYNQTTDVIYGKHGSDNLTAVSDPVLTTGFDGRANQALAFNGTTQYLTQKIYLSNSATANQLMLSTADGQAFLQHFTTDFSAYAAPSLANKPYMAVIKDAGLDVAWAYADGVGTDTLGAELLTNGGFDTDTTWIKGGNWIINNGVASCTNPVSSHYLMQGVPLVNGILYKLQYTVVSNTLSTQMGFGLSSGGAFGSMALSTSIGMHTYYLNCIDSDSVNDLMFYLNTATGIFELDNVSVKAVTESLGAELVTNGDMELDADWSNYGSPTVNERSDVQKHAGSYSRHVVTDAIFEGIQSVSFPIINGALYKFSCWVYLVSGSVSIDPADSDFSVAYAGTTTTGAWKFLYFYATAIRDNAVAVIKIWNGTSAVSEFYVDDVSIKKVTAPIATGLKLYSTKTGSVQNMAGTAAAFGPNEALTYEVRKTDFQISGALTVGAWVKGVAQSDKAVLSKYETTKNKRSWNMGASNLSTSKFQVLLSSNGSSITKDYTSGLTAFDSNWHLISFTYDGNNTLKLYVDGVLDTPTKTTDTAMTTIYDADKSIATGAYSANYAATGFFNGSIARPFIYNRALSATEVLNLYNDSSNKTFLQ